MLNLDSCDQQMKSVLAVIHRLTPSVNIPQIAPGGQPNTQKKLSPLYDVTVCVNGRKRHGQGLTTSYTVFSIFINGNEHCPASLKSTLLTQTDFCIPAIILFRHCCNSSNCTKKPHIYLFCLVLVTHLFHCAEFMHWPSSTD